MSLVSLFFRAVPCPSCSCPCRAGPSFFVPCLGRPMCLISKKSPAHDGPRAGPDPFFSCRAVLRAGLFLRASCRPESPRPNGHHYPRPPLLSTPGDPHSAQIPFRRREEKKTNFTVSSPATPSRRRRHRRTSRRNPSTRLPARRRPPISAPRIAARVGWTGRPIAPLQSTARARDRRTPPGDLLSRRDRPGFSAPLPPHQARAPRTESGGRQQDPAKSNT